MAPYLLQLGEWVGSMLSVSGDRYATVIDAYIIEGPSMISSHDYNYEPLFVNF